MNPIFNVAPHPLRSMEVRIWMTQNPSKICTAKGKYGESLLHWTCLSDIGLTLDLINAGIDPNVLDDDGRTPLDWLSDRLLFSCVYPENREKSFEVRQTLKSLTEKIGLVFIPRGAKGKNTIEAWARAGLWELIQAEMNRDGEMIYIKNKGFSPLHFFPIAAFDHDQEAIEFMEKALAFGLDINYANKDGFTPLMVGVEQWLLGYVPNERLKYMIKKGADIEVENNFGYSCMDLVQQKSPNKVFELQELLNLE